MIQVGDTVVRIWGNDWMRNKMRVSAIDNEFVYCDAQTDKDGNWTVLPPGSEPWKFDRIYGVETDETQGWGIEPYGRNLVLTRIVEVTYASEGAGETNDLPVHGAAREGSEMV